MISGEMPLYGLIIGEEMILAAWNFSEIKRSQYLDTFFCSIFLS